MVMSLVLAFAWKYHEGGVFLDGGDRGRDFSGEGEEDYDGAYQRLPSLLSLEVCIHMNICFCSVSLIGPSFIIAAAVFRVDITFN